MQDIECGRTMLRYDYYCFSRVECVSLVAVFGAVSVDDFAVLVAAIVVVAVVAAVNAVVEVVVDGVVTLSLSNFLKSSRWPPSQVPIIMECKKYLIRKKGIISRIRKAVANI